MSSNEYEFLTRWRVTGTTAEVYDVLIDVLAYPRWWPEVYLAVNETHPPGPHGLGQAARLLTKGKLPYKVRWDSRVIETRYPDGYTLTANGDFVGRGIWTFVQEGPEVAVTFDWRLRAEKPLIRSLSFLFKPIFAANHRWAMARGEEGLKRELLRRRSLVASRLSF